jgi:hypothetical protein
MAWTKEGLWRLDAAKSIWEKLPGKAGVGGPAWESGLVYDSKRDRLLLPGANGRLCASSVSTNDVQVLEPAGMSNTVGLARESVYLPDFDAVLIGARPPKAADNKPRWLLYDCGQNAWKAVHLPGKDPGIGESLGLVYDPKRKLVWAMNILSQPHVLKLELGTADVVELK